MVSDTEERALLSKDRPPAEGQAAEAQSPEHELSHEPCKPFTPLLEKLLGGCCYRHRESLIPLARSPHAMQNHGQLAGHGHQRPLLAALAARGRQFQSPAPQ